MTHLFAKTPTRAVTLAVAVALAALTSACSTIKVAHDYDPAFDFTRLQTWKWSEESQMKTGNAIADTDGLTAGRIENAVKQTLGQRGYKQTENEQSDFEVAWFLTVEDKTNVTTINDYHGYGPGYGWYGGGYSSSRTVVDNYQQGNIIRMDEFRV